MLKFGFPDIYNQLLLLKLRSRRIKNGNNEISLYQIYLISLTINIGVMKAMKHKVFH
jgi:hypothetical protein